jgi:anaerobic magnesium-protoporphyrin IX monomethyl ester cyclase
MKVALVIPPDPPGLNNFNQVPISGLYTAGQLIAAGVETEFHDLRAGQPDLAARYAVIAAADLVVVLSTDYDLAQCYPSLRPAAECVRHIKDSGAVRVVCGGSHATVDAGLTRSFTGADGVVAGELEFAVPDLVRHLGAGGTLLDTWPPDGAYTADEARLASLGLPAYHLAPMSHYASEGFVDGTLDRVNSGLVLANRGCPFACNFCYLFFGRRLRRRPVEATVAELSAMCQDHGIRHFFFLDYTFTLDEAWVRAICEHIRKAGLDISWLCQTRVDCLSEPVLRMMKDAGCAGIWLGVESPELEQRRYLSKGRIGFEDIQQAVRLIRGCGMQVLAFVMVGVPNETQSSLRSLNNWLDDSEVYYSLSTFQRRPGTPLAHEAGSAGQDDWEQLDVASEFLGDSELRMADLRWFFDYHQNSPRRVKNIMANRSSGREALWNR